MLNSNFANTVADFNELVKKFQYEVAHQRYYHADLIKHENENAPTIGLDNHRKEMAVFQSKITNYSANPLQVLLSNEVSVTEWHYQFDHADWGKRDFKQLSIQRWKEGKIVHERHLYATEKW